jgi:hypothetical protein
LTNFNARACRACEYFFAAENPLRKAASTIAANAAGRTVERYPATLE